MARQQVSQFSLRSIDVSRGSINNGVWEIQPNLFAKSIEFARLRMWNLFWNIQPASTLPNLINGVPAPASGNVFSVNQGGVITITIQPGYYFSDTGAVTLATALAFPTDGLNDIRYVLLRLFNAASAGSLQSVSVDPSTFILTLTWNAATTSISTPTFTGMAGQTFTASSSWVSSSLPLNLSWPSEIMMVIEELQSSDRYIVGAQVPQNGSFYQTVVNIPIYNTYGELITYEPQQISEMTLRPSSAHGQTVISYLSIKFLDTWGNIVPFDTASQTWDCIFYIRTAVEGF